MVATTNNMRRLITMASAAVVLLITSHGDMLPLAMGFLAPVPTAARTQLVSPWSHPFSSSCAEPSPGTAAADTAPPKASWPTCEQTRRFFRANPRRTTTATTTCCAAADGAPAGAGAGAAADAAADNRLHDTGGGSAPSAVIAAAENDTEQEREATGPEVGGTSGRWGASAGLIPVEGLDGGDGVATTGAPSLAMSENGVAGGIAAAGGSLAHEFEWDAAAPWTEFEDWLLQDTYSR